MRTKDLPMPDAIPQFFLQSSVVHPFKLHPIDGPADCVVNQALNVMVRVDGRGAEPTFERWAVLEYKEIRLGAALNQDIAWEDVLDGYSDELMALRQALYVDMVSLGSGLDYRADVEALMPVSNIACDLLYIESANLADTDIGLAALEVLIQHSNCGMAIMPLSVAPCDEEVTPRRVAQLARLGFAKMPGQPFLVLDLGMRRPSVLNGYASGC